MPKASSRTLQSKSRPGVEELPKRNKKGREGGERGRKEGKKGRRDR
jgi:hypothetical protein